MSLPEEGRGVYWQKCQLGVGLLGSVRNPEKPNRHPSNAEFL